MTNYHLKFQIKKGDVVDWGNAYVQADSVGDAEAKALKALPAEFPSTPATEDKEAVKVELVIVAVEKTDVFLIV